MGNIFSKDIGGIIGLNIENIDFIQGATNTPNSISFNTDKSINTVFHGHSNRFKYDFYGIHKGTEDRLTFVGNPQKKILADFIDCRINSSTWGKKYQTDFYPDLSKLLVIPQGIAHTFDGLEDIYTINTFRNFLPDPNEWIQGIDEWKLSSDTINLSRSFLDSEIPKLKCNVLEASDVFYKITSSSFEANLDGIILEYPFTIRFNFDDNTTKLVKFKKKQSETAITPKFLEIENFKGIGWRRRIIITSGVDTDSGYTVFTGPNSVRFFNHGEKCEIIESGEENISLSKWATFFGDKSKNIKVAVKTTNGWQTIFVNPNPSIDLVIPPDTEYRIENFQECFIVIKSV